MQLLISTSAAFVAMTGFPSIKTGKPYETGSEEPQEAKRGMIQEVESG